MTYLETELLWVVFENRFMVVFRFIFIFSIYDNNKQDLKSIPNPISIVFSTPLCPLYFTILIVRKIQTIINENNTTKKKKNSKCTFLGGWGVVDYFCIF